MMASHPGKAMRSLTRNTMAKGYDAWADLHFGGRKGGYVSQASLVLRLYAQIAHKAGVSFFLTFLDIRSAYYRLYQQWAASSGFNDQDFARFLQQLGQPPETMHEFLALFQKSSAMKEAGFSSHHEAVVASENAATWFVFPSSNAITSTTVGVRPGDSIADIMFSLVFSRLLHDVMSHFHSQGWTVKSCCIHKGKVEWSLA